MEDVFFDRDMSWLSFNERVLSEAARAEVPLGERLRFLSIYSSNLDEFYRVRIPALMALHKITGEQAQKNLLDRVHAVIGEQQAFFGRVLARELIPALAAEGVRLWYHETLPAPTREAVRDYFRSEAAAFIQRVYLDQAGDFFPQSNHIYLLVKLAGMPAARAVVNIPSDSLPRFFEAPFPGGTEVVFLDDIVRESLDLIFPEREVEGCWSFKVTRDAELNLQDEYGGDIAEAIERQIAKRDMGLATRLLYDGRMPLVELAGLAAQLGFKSANRVQGGRYHNLKDLAGFPAGPSRWYYPAWPPQPLADGSSVLARMEAGDFMVHPPYQDYDIVLRFFNEVSLDERVTDIYITLYRVASDSRIAHALISAAKNGKRVLVFVELLARFDEANNLRWAKRMKEAGVKLVYSIPGMKVHAKMALVKRKADKRDVYYGLLSTGNLNESTARFYTDHILFTSDKAVLREMELLFLFLKKREKPGNTDTLIRFEHLYVAPFNLLECLRSLIRFEAAQARKGLEASITLKLNNLEEETLISELYRASQAGVRIQLIVRSICRLVPGVPGLSEGIRVRRIVDRYLEHGRVCIFHHGGNEKILMGSADWMERNLFRRIEVCFPVYDAGIRKEIREMVGLALRDNTQAVTLDAQLRNVPVPAGDPPVRSQKVIYERVIHHP